MEEFNEMKQRDKVTAGLKGGPFTTSPNVAPRMDFEACYDKYGVKEKMDGGTIPQPKPLDVWIKRRPNSSM